MAFHNFFLTRIQEIEQTTTVDDFYIRFDALRGLIEFTEPGFPESYYTSWFINGLVTEVHAYVEGFHPVTVQDAYYLALIFDTGYSRTIRSISDKAILGVANDHGVEKSVATHGGQHIAEPSSNIGNHSTDDFMGTRPTDEVSLLNSEVELSFMHTISSDVAIVNSIAIHEGSCVLPTVLLASEVSTKKSLCTSHFNPDMFHCVDHEVHFVGNTATLRPHVLISALAKVTSVSSVGSSLPIDSIISLQDICTERSTTEIFIINFQDAHSLVRGDGDAFYSIPEVGNPSVNTNYDKLGSVVANQRTTHSTLDYIICFDPGIGHQKAGSTDKIVPIFSGEQILHMLCGQWVSINVLVGIPPAGSSSLCSCAASALALLVMYFFWQVCDQEVKDFAAGSELMIVIQVATKWDGVAAICEPSRGHRVNSPEPIPSVGTQFVQGYNYKATSLDKGNDSIVSSSLEISIVCVILDTSVCLGGKDNGIVEDISPVHDDVVVATSIHVGDLFQGYDSNKFKSDDHCLESSSRENESSSFRFSSGSCLPLATGVGATKCFLSYTLNGNFIRLFADIFQLHGNKFPVYKGGSVQLFLFVFASQFTLLPSVAAMTKASASSGECQQFLSASAATSVPLSSGATCPAGSCLRSFGGPPPMRYFTVDGTSITFVATSSVLNLSNQLQFGVVSLGNLPSCDRMLFSKAMCISNTMAYPLVMFLWLIAWSTNLVIWHSHFHINLAISSRVLVAIGSVLLQSSQLSNLGKGISAVPPTLLAITTVHNHVVVAFDSSFALLSSIVMQGNIYYSLVEGSLQDSLHDNFVQVSLQVLLLTDSATCVMVIVIGQGMMEQQHETINSTSRNNIDDTEAISILRAWQAVVLITVSSSQLLTLCPRACQVILIPILYKLLHTMRQHKHYGGLHSEGLLQALWIRAPRYCLMDPFSLENSRLSRSPVLVIRRALCLYNLCGHAISVWGFSLAIIQLGTQFNQAQQVIFSCLTTRCWLHSSFYYKHIHYSGQVASAGLLACRNMWAVSCILGDYGVQHWFNFSALLRHKQFPQQHIITKVFHCFQLYWYTACRSYSTFFLYLWTTVPAKEAISHLDSCYGTNGCFPSVFVLTLLDSQNFDNMVTSSLRTRKTHIPRIGSWLFRMYFDCLSLFFRSSPLLFMQCSDTLRDTVLTQVLHISLVASVILCILQACVLRDCFVQPAIPVPLWWCSFGIFSTIASRTPMVHCLR